MFASGGDGIDHLEWTSDGRAEPERGRCACPHGPSPAPQPPRRPPRRRAPRARRRPRLRLGRRCARTWSPRCPTPRAPPDRPALVVAGDDRQARDLAADLRAWLAPRPVRFYPSRGVAYESHLAPPPHLVGLRVAALDALLAARARREPPVVVVCAVALSEKVPDPALRPQLVHDPRRRPGRPRRARRRPRRRRLRARRPGRGPRPVRDPRRHARRLPGHRGPAVRVDLFDIEIESLRWFSTFTQRSLGERRARSRSRPPPSSRPSTASSPRSRRSRTPTSAPTSRSCCRSTASTPSRPRAGRGRGAAGRRGGPRARARRPLAGRLRRVPRRRRPPPLRAPDAITAALDERAHVAPDARSAADQPLEFRAQAADVAARSLREAEPELEKLVRSGYRTVVTWARRGDGERAAYNLARLQPAGSRRRARRAEAGLQFARGAAARRLRRAPACSSRSSPTIGSSAVAAPSARPDRRRSAAAARCARSRTCAPATSSCTRTTASRASPASTPRRSPGSPATTSSSSTPAPTASSCPSTSSPRSRATSAPGAEHPPLSKLGGKALGDAEGARAARRAGARGRAAEPLRRAPPAHGPRVPRRLRLAARVRGGLPLHRDARPARRDRARQGRHGARRSRWTGWSAATSATARPRSRCAPPSRPPRTGSRCSCWLRRRSSPSSTSARSPSAWRDYPFTSTTSAASARPRSSARPWPPSTTGRVDILDRHPPPALAATCAARTSGCSIVDEEQRFGVKQKELLRQLKLKVDVISMSATPIPRTLQMSLAGMRDISVIETPPEGRRPVKTYVGEYDEQLVRQALEREQARGGQAFFVHNRVETIDETAERLRGLCPGVRFEVAHGQIEERELERPDARVPARRGRRARRHQHHRVGHRHPAGQHADRRARRHVRPRPALPDPRARRALAASAPTPTCCTRARPR